jgi:gluconokinase
MSVTRSDKAVFPLILALDAGTSSIRALLYDARGFVIEGLESRINYQMDRVSGGGVEINADHWCELLIQVIDEILLQAGELSHQIRAVAMCSFWHSLVGVNGDHQAITPIYNWNDTRSAPDVSELSSIADAGWLHSRTGCRPHSSYYPAKLLWLRRTNPALFSQVRRWMSPAEYFYLRLSGKAQCGISMASGTGLFNQHECLWDREVLSLLKISLDDLSPLSSGAEDDEPFVGLRDEYAERWPALSNIPWMPAIGDGAASNIGSGGFTSDIIAINVGTSGAMRVCWPAEYFRIPTGLWGYRANKRYVLIGGALSNGGDVYAWCQQTLQLDERQLEEQLAALEPDAHGLTVLPFFSGERATGYASHARAAIVGLSLNTQPVEILRASLEAVCYRFAAIYELLRGELPQSARVVASGGGILKSTVWTQMLADVLGVPVIESAVPEASSRGAAVMALKALNVITDYSDVPAEFGETHEPIHSHQEIYQNARARQEKIYDQLIAQDSPASTH